MKTIVTVKRGNKDANLLCKEIDITPHEYDNLKEISRIINSKLGEECFTAYVCQI